MSLTEAAHKKMSKDEAIALTLDFQAKFISTLANIADLKSDFRSFESELSISRSVNTKLCDSVTSLESQCWAKNQYTRSECLEVTEVPQSTENAN